MDFVIGQQIVCIGDFDLDTHNYHVHPDVLLPKEGQVFHFDGYETSAKKQLYLKEETRLHITIKKRYSYMSQYFVPLQEWLNKQSEADIKKIETEINKIVPIEIGV